MRMLTAVSLSLLALALLSSGCGGKARPGLLGEMPAGLDFYLAFSPEGLGLSEALESLREAGLEGSNELAMAGAALGIDPLSWDDWVEATGLDPQGEIGFAGYMSQGEISAMALFLPVSDPAALESFLEAAPEESGVRLSEWTDGMWALLASDVPQQLETIAEAAEGGRRLAEDEDFALLWDALSAGQSDAYVYVRTHGQPELQAVLLALEEEGGVARAAAAALPSGPQFAQSLDVLARGPAGTEPGLPPDVDIVVRSTADMGAVAEMAEDRMPPDASQGLNMLGFDSMEDMLSMFSGDSWGAVDLSGGSVRGLAVIGLDDPEAMEGFLGRLSGFAAMGDQQVDRIQGAGVSGYSIPISSGSDSWPLEVGVSGSALYVLYGYSLQDAPGWSSTPGAEDALGIDHGAPVFVSGDISEIRDHIPEDGEGILPNADRFALSIRSEGDAAVMEGALDTGEERAFVAVAQAAFTTGMRVYEARITPPEEVESK